MQERELRITKSFRDLIDLKKSVFSTNSKLQKIYTEANNLSFAYNKRVEDRQDSSYLSASKLNTCAILHIVYQKVLTDYLETENPDLFIRLVGHIKADKQLIESVEMFSINFPKILEKESIEDFEIMEELRAIFMYHVMLDNSALRKAMSPLIRDNSIVFPKSFRAIESLLGCYAKSDRVESSENERDIFDYLTKPGRLYPNDLKGQLEYIIKEWGHLLGDEFLALLNSSISFMLSEEKDRGTGDPAFKGSDITTIDYSNMNTEYVAFSADTNWMPKVVMIAKSTLVWLDQLSKWYKKDISTLDKIPDEELDKLQEKGITALWLIGLWSRSESSKTIKRLCGNAEAEASAYSLKDYEISAKIGGYEALHVLRVKCERRGIRLASDMVPNHTGIDGEWVYSHPEYFVSQDYPPFPSYTYNGPDLSTNPNFEIKIEDHYYDRTDAAVTFMRRNKATGETKYIFHGNDGTTMPWNDTAQIDYLNSIAREAVIQKIIHVAKNFPIIRFDAAMTLAKRHIQRLWYPLPGTGADIAGRVMYSMSDQQFNDMLGEEFWRTVVDRIAKEAPDTLLLAEAFWMMEGYFVRTLGMHRVYNSAFMHMLKNEDNQKYRQGIKDTLVYEPEILKRYVNFLNNPDEETAIEQFGDGGKYFSVCTILSTLPGLPMFGHGQFEGFREKYGMEYSKAYYDEVENEYFVQEHLRRISPLLKKRYLFSGVENFNLYDAYNNGNIEESIYAYSNGVPGDRNLVLVNNSYYRISANVKTSVNKLNAEGKLVTESLADNLKLHFGGRNYMIYEDFNTKLTYIVPSVKIFDEGFTFTIDGYSSIVLWNIREVEDIDGSYRKLYKFLDGKGVESIQYSIALLRLSPIYDMLNCLRSPQFLNGLSNIVQGTSSRENEKSSLMTLAEVYTHLDGCLVNLEATTLAALPSIPREIAPMEMIKIFKGLSQVVSTKVFSSYAAISKDIYYSIAAICVLMPFVDREELTLSDAFRVEEKLMLNYFFTQNDNAKISNERMSQLMSFAVISLAAGHDLVAVYKKGPLAVMNKLFENDSVKKLVKCNVFNNIVWYNKELMQELIVLTALSLKMSLKSKFNSDKFIDELFEIETNSEYQLEKFLSEDLV